MEVIYNIEFWRIVFLFLAIWMTLVNIPKIIRGHYVSWVNFIIQAIGITGFIYLQWLI